MAKDKKQKHKAKRDAKKRELRRRDALGPVKRLAMAAGEAECWMSDGLESMGQAQIFAYKSAGGLGGVACFLVDRGVVGLKDAWTRVPLEAGEFREMLEYSSRASKMRRASVEEVRRLVGGGMRWASENGMRLPKDLAKPLSLIGGVDGWESADVSAFVMEFAGHPEDLRQRLIGEPLESYLKRKDVSFVFSDAAPYNKQGTGQYIDDDREAATDDVSPAEEFNAMAARLRPAADAVAEETAKWLSERGETASAELTEAWCSMMLSAMLARASLPNGTAEEISKFADDLRDGIGGRLEASRFEGYDRGVEQVLKYLEVFPRSMGDAVRKHGILGEPERPSGPLLLGGEDLEAV